MGRQFVNCKALYKCHVSELFYDNRNFSLEGQMSVFFYSSDSYAYPFSIDLKYSLSAYFMTAVRNRVDSGYDRKYMPTSK